MHICPGLAGQREDVAVAQPLGMDRLAALDIGQRAEPVAIDGRQLKSRRSAASAISLPSRACTPVDLPARKFFASSTSSA